MLFSDWSHSGQRDLRVSNDRHYYREGEEQLWRIVPGEPPTEYTEADGWRPLQIWGMGIASQDVTGDGLPEVFLTSQGDNKLQTLEAGAERPEYRDIALELGVTAHRPYTGDDVLPSTAWHPEFADVNNDGHADLFVTKGNVEAQVEQASDDPSNLLIGKEDGSFEEQGEAAGIVSFERARGAAVVDLNLDGLLDIVVVNRRAPVTLWRNVGRRRRGAARSDGPLDRRPAASNPRRTPTPSARGSRCAPGDRTTAREVTVGGGHASGALGWLHTGIGDASERRGPRAVARRHRRSVDDGERGRAGDDCTRRISAERVGAAMRTTRPTGRHLVARLRDARHRAVAPADALRRAARAPPLGDGGARLHPSRRVGGS